MTAEAEAETLAAGFIGAHQVTWPTINTDRRRSRIPSEPTGWRTSSTTPAYVYTTEGKPPWKEKEGEGGGGKIHPRQMLVVLTKLF